MKVLCIGDAMIPGVDLAESASALGTTEVVATDWERDWSGLQHRRLVVEQRGPAAEPVPDAFADHRDADVGLGLFAPWSAEGMDRFEQLRLIGVARAGVENVDLAAATERGILVLNVLGRNAEAVSDYTVGMILAEARNIARSHAAISAGQWRKEFSNSAFVPELHGKTIGIVGFGHIGQLVARKLGGFQVRVLAFDPFASPDALAAAGAHAATLDQLLRESDVVTLHARLTPESQGLIGRDELAKMQPTAYLVNTARSGLVDGDALVDALREQRIAGAALDVFDREPLAEGDPLLELDNVTLTSHLAGTTREALTRSPELLVGAVRDVLAGRPSPSLRNPEVLDRTDVRGWLESTRTTDGAA
ncbi:MAG TPA: 2-hydroxyacid dehydrogenase [Baekduia sp.]|nr:2-hydroxyacid dehydrogenase [Baekduia sp.]